MILLTMMTIIDQFVTSHQGHQYAEKEELMQMLIIEEVITKWNVNIRAFRKGLFNCSWLSQSLQRL